jgi:hypothetical protein
MSQMHPRRLLLCEYNIMVDIRHPEVSLRHTFRPYGVVQLHSVHRNVEENWLGLGDLRTSCCAVSVASRQHRCRPHEKENDEKENTT